MFGQYFGNYLVEKNKISQKQYEDAIRLQQSSRAKLGFIAVAEKLLTNKQAEEINELQKTMDHRFGDIAIEKGYLLTEEVTYLLNMQGNPYLMFVQVLTENNILSYDEIEASLEEFKKDNGFSDSDLDALKSGDIDRIIPVFVDVDVPFGGECISLTIRNLVRFIDSNVTLKKAYKVKDYAFGNLAYQQMIGDHQIFVGFAGKHKELLAIAQPFAKEAFSDMDEDAFDSVCEFINCSNGLYASKLSLEDIHIDMTPPLFFTGKRISSNGDIYVVPVIINGKQNDLLISVNSKVGIN
ncbi:MAG TPA: chemotaxis protein CheX [Mobilitalea sp.]|nr:chemotaxis protein CheX [Mobilitalea sp.]